ncbi:MAG TPA: hypothetical protein VMQ76_10825 [Terracidiphilus sp.]|nr:hypothetical protein [Terracidiphilus sp.]
MKTTVIYHSADFDGIFCREIARKFLPQDTEFIGWNFGDPMLEFPSGQVYILDLSAECIYAPSVVEGWEARLIWIDHHKSSIERWAKDIPGYRIDGVAACRLAWQWFTHKFFPGASNPLPSKQDFINRKVSEPYAVRLAGEYDIWDKRDPNAELFQMGLRSRKLDDVDWRQLLHIAKGRYNSKLVHDLLDAGESVQFYAQNQNESIIKSAGFDLDFEGLHFLACNHARYNSLLFTAGLKPEHDACLGFAWRGGNWTVSLYHAPGKEHHDLSLIAVKHGGGGHRGACGFTCQTLPFSLK